MPTTLPLHLKYRPQTLESLVGQPDVQTTLSNAVKRNRIPPAILLIGPKGTGKTSTARIFAKSINCLSDRPTLNPCGKCESCRSIESSISLDVTEMDAASHGGVDDARELIQRIQIAPVKGAYRVVILDEAQMLTREAQNALLKTFEEPPGHVVFILCTTDPHKILPTIVSRCLTLTFRSLAIDTVCNHLKHIADQEAIAITSDAIR
ncbi:MAG: DNA polymerase III subunit gamma/tau, partial [Leptolyngbyaceae cyanobacterium bins.302]|nr:DNA polymerase III subunit gamma/tau [Leptolyngbyaceae cyanobacterium bins.302]